MKNIVLLSCVVLGASGCLPIYTIPDDRPQAEFVLAAENESKGTTVRNVYTWVFKNEECEKTSHGMRAGSKVLGEKDKTTEPVKILAGEKFVFTSAYIDARFGQNRKCSITGSFVPQPNRKYKALLLVNEQVTACRLGIYDTTGGKEEQVPFVMPGYVCEDGGKTTRLNGQPLWTNWQIQFVR